MVSGLLYINTKILWTGLAENLNNILENFEKPF